MYYVLELLILLISILTALHIWLKFKQNYWSSRKIPHLPATSIFGHWRDIILLRVNAAYVLKDLYNHKTVENEAFFGAYIFGKPVLIIRDPELVKNILVKDFNSFSDRYVSVDAHNDILGAYNIFIVKNPEWRAIRSNISPVFTSGKIKQMFQHVEDVGTELDDYLQSLTKSTGSASKELKELCALYNTDVIASIAFGIQANSIKNPNGSFRTNGRKIFTFSLGRAIDVMILFFLPELKRLFNAQVFTNDVSKFLRSAINDAIENREKTGAKRNDLIDLLIEIKNSGLNNKTSKEHITEDYLVAQAAIFFNGGFETTSATMSFGLYELAKNPEFQEKLRKEIKDTLKEYNEILTYDTIYNMNYLNAVILEALRLYPSLPHLDRECTAVNGYSMEPFSDFVIPKGMPVFIPSYSIQRDSKYYIKPEQFNPDRFLIENKADVNPYTHLGFGIGPHNCIGKRFALLQVKIGFISILRNHFVRASHLTPKTMHFNPRAINIQSDIGINVDIVYDPLLT